MTLADYGITVEPKEGNQLTVCPRCSHDRKKSTEKCLSVDAVKGIWNCHHCGWKGRVEDPEHIEDRRLMLEFFEKRGISAQTVFSAGITCEKGEIKFPYTKRWREVNAKYRRIAEKKFRQTQGGERSLYGLDEVPVGTKRLVWVEGEIDALSMRECGIIAVSVPDGAPNPGNAEGAKLSFLDAPDFEFFLNSIPTHVIAVDEDAPGRTLRDALVSRIGFEKCEIVSWIDLSEAGKTSKDANEYLVKYGREALIERVDQSKQIPVEGVFSVKDLGEDMYRDFQHGIERGLDVGIGGLENLWTLRPRELSIIHGYPSSGKSAFMTRIAVNMAKKHNWKFAMFPAENLPLYRYANELIEYYIEKPITDITGNKITGKEYMKAFEFAHNHFSFIMPEEDASLDSILSRASVQIRRWGANAIVIDPWTEIYMARNGKDDRQTDQIERGLRKVKKFAQTNCIHFFIVAHPSKPKEGVMTHRPPHPTEISGSMQWFNKPDCIIAINRPDREKSEVDAYVQKIRFREVGQHGKASLTFDRWSGVYSPRHDYGSTDGNGNRRFARKG